MSTLPVRRVGDIGESPLDAWLVDSLWTHQAVGLVAGHAKLGKSWLALDFAVSVATGTPVLDRFAVNDPGPVLLFPAEDSPTAVRDRLAGICRHRGVDLAGLNVWVIESSILRLDSREDCDALGATVEEFRPRLLILDPLIRLHSSDENSAVEIARILSFLRDLQRRYATAVLVVHHARKCSSSDPGLGLRGSSEIRAWSDSTLYMRRNKGLELIVEHRGAPAPQPLRLMLGSDEPANTHLAIEGEAPAQPAAPPDLGELIVELLRTSAPLSRDDIRRRLAVRNQVAGAALATLMQDGLIEKCSTGFRLTDTTTKSDRSIPTLCWEASS
jgi:hypothetical protein